MATSTSLDELQARYDAFVRDNLARDAHAALDARVSGLHSFLHSVHAHHPRCGGIALITSGGTRVALEVNAVRYLTNFSSGGRGACLVESFVRRGWACVLLHHTSAIRPFRRVLDVLSTEELFAMSGAYDRASSPRADTTEAHDGDNNNNNDNENNDDSDDGDKGGNRGAARGAVAAATVAKVRRMRALYETSKHLVYYIAFDTIVEYLYLLQRLASSLARDMPPALPLRTRPLLFFAAAAVSDYFIPRGEMSEQKISSPTGITLQLAPVPKLLPLLRHVWLHRDADQPQTLFVAFKLETSAATLREKAVRSLQACACDAVVANMLQTYKREVLLYVAGEDTTRPRVVRRCHRDNDDDGACDNTAAAAAASASSSRDARGVCHNNDDDGGGGSGGGDEHTVEDALVRVFVDMAVAKAMATAATRAVHSA